jgi:hypothetical protein
MRVLCITSCMGSSFEDVRSSPLQTLSYPKSMKESNVAAAFIVSC